MPSRDVLEKYKSEIEPNLERNQQIIVNMANLRSTLMKTAYGTKYDEKYNNSIFDYRNSSESCMDINQVTLLDPRNFCICRPHNWRELGKSL